MNYHGFLGQRKKADDSHCQRSLLSGGIEYRGLLLLPSLGTFPDILVKEICTESLSSCPVASYFSTFNLADIIFILLFL